MRTRQSSNVDRTNTPRESASPEPASSALAREGADLIALADDIIQRSLSGQSEDFINANRQQGGQ